MSGLVADEMMEVRWEGEGDVGMGGAGVVVV